MKFRLSITDTLLALNGAVDQGGGWGLNQAPRCLVSPLPHCWCKFWPLPPLWPTSASTAHSSVQT